MTVAEQISDGAAILRKLERVPAWHTPHWTELGFPVIDRGDYAIFPLARASGAEAIATLRDTETRLRTEFIHFYGGDFFHAESKLDVDAGYGRTLVDAGAVVSGLNWWSIQNLAVVLVRSLDHERALETLAIHALPKEWVRAPPLNPGTNRAASRARRMIREQALADVRWAWPLERTENPSN